MTLAFSSKCFCTQLYSVAGGHLQRAQLPLHQAWAGMGSGRRRGRGRGAAGGGKGGGAGIMMAAPQLRQAVNDWEADVDELEVGV